MFHAAEAARWMDAPGRWASTAADGPNGAFRLPSPEPGWLLAVIASDGDAQILRLREHLREGP